jgi:hypothetical protein
MNRSLLCRLSVAMLVVLVNGSLSRANVLSSAPFSLGYGFSGDPASTWNVSETASVNTPTTQGNFTFVPAPVGDRFSGDGPTFINRVLGDGHLGTGVNVSGFITSAFALPVTARYTGPAPTNALPTPNYRLQIDITQVSVYAGEHPSSSVDIPFQWNETTATHTQSSPQTTLIVSKDYNEHKGYQQVVWNPDDYAVPLSGLNDSFTRTFDITAMDNIGDLRYMDGLEIEGTVSLIYDGVGIPGDYNNNGVVDGADYVLWRSGGPLQNEVATPGSVTPEDYTEWRARFGNTAGSGSGLGGAMVPEPSTFLLLCFSALITFCVRR